MFNRTFLKSLLSILLSALFLSAPVGLSLELNEPVRILVQDGEIVESDDGELFDYAEHMYTCRWSLYKFNIDDFYVANYRKPTCSEEGYTGEVICLNCGQVLLPGKSIEMVPHDMHLIGDKKPTCDDEGYSGDTICAGCGYTKYGTVIPATGHDIHHYGVVAETCVTAGYTGDDICDYCGQVFSLGNTIEPLGHNIITEGQRDPTCTEPGFTGIDKCSRCGAVLSEGSEIPPLNHCETEVRNFVAATMDAGGYSGDTYCKLCGELVQKGKNTARIISNDDKKGKYDWEYTHNAEFPLKYSDETLTITIDKIWHDKSWVYVAKIELKDYSRFFTCYGTKKYGGQSSTSAVAKKYNAIFATNCDYSAPKIQNQVIRNGLVYNKGEKKCGDPGYYCAATGMIGSAAMLGVKDMTLNDAAAQKLVTDSFCFGPAFKLQSSGNNTSSRAQRTFIGTDGIPGHIYLCVSEGRYKDGVSPGLTYQGCAEVLMHYGCTFGCPLDGGGSSTMVFQGKILNHMKKERAWICDFCVIK